MSKLRQYEHKNHETGEVIDRVYHFWCPGCDELHTYTCDRAPGLRPGWVFDGNWDAPSFTPSLLYPSKPVRCHLFLRNGQIEYCGDCDHKFAGQTVPMVEIDPEYEFETATRVA